jgi:murein DD-endopeptidase MepM/ murein hydrolase activator NlpD
MDLGFGKPVPGGLTIIGGGWGHGPGGKHAGIDIRLPVGTPIVAVADGVVSRASASTDNGGMGIFAVITHPTGVVTRYLHMSQLLVATGEQVSRGQTIGLSGNTGNSAGPHLHFDIKVLSPLVLQQIAAEVGEPPSGFEDNITGFGFGIPAEPWVPADGYDDKVVTGALANGIPLHSERDVSDPASSTRKLGPILLLGIAVGLFYVLWRHQRLV